MSDSSCLVAASKRSFGAKFVLVAATTILWAGAAVAQPNAVPVAPAGGAAAQPATTQPAGPPPKFRCDEPEYKFGQVWAMEKVEHTFIVHNDGEGVLTLEARPTCGCTVAEYDKTVAPGGQGKIKTVLSTGNYTTTYRKVINVITNDPAQKNVPLTLSGDVKQRIIAEPHLAAYFGQLAPGVNLTKTFKLTNNTDQPMKLSVATTTQPSCFKASIKELEPGKTAELTITAEPPFKEDTNAAQIVINTGIENVPDLVVPCSLIKPPAIQLMPPIVRLPSTPVPSIYRQLVTVRNNSDKPVKVLSATANDERIKLEPKEVQPNKVWTVQIEVPAGFTPEPGKQPVVTITTDYEAKPSYTVPLIAMAMPRQTATQPAFVTPESLVGRMAPSMLIDAVDGRSVRIGGGTKQVTVVNFWASWCTPSRTQLVMLEQIYQAYRRRGVEFINVSVDQYRAPEELSGIVRSLDSKIPFAFDFDKRLLKGFGVSDVPVTFLIGSNGIVEAVRRGIGRNDDEIDLVADVLKEQIEKLIEGKTRAEFTSRPASTGMLCRIQQLPFSPGANAQGPVLGVEALSQDAGLFKPKSKGEYKLYYRNTGGQPLEIKSIKPSSGLTIDDSYPKTLAPGATGSVNCSFQTPDRPGPLSHEVLFETNGAMPSLSVTITARTRPYVEVQMVGRAVDFSVGGVRAFSVPRLATLIYNGADNVEYKAPQSSSPKFEAAVQPTRQPSVSIVTVKALPPFEPGDHKATITIETNLPEQPVVEVPVKLHMPPRIEVKPESVEVPPVRTVHQIPVSIVNSGTGALNILGVDKTKPEIQTQFFPEPDGLSYKLQITLPADFVCDPGGEKVTIRTDDKEFKEIAIPIRGGAGPGVPRPRGTAPFRAPVTPPAGH